MYYYKVSDFFYKSSYLKKDNLFRFFAQILLLTFNLNDLNEVVFILLGRMHLPLNKTLMEP